MADFLPTRHQHKVDVSVCYARYIISFFLVSLTKIKRQKKRKRRRNKTREEPSRIGRIRQQEVVQNYEAVKRHVLDVAWCRWLTISNSSKQARKKRSVKRWDEVKRNSKKGATLITYVLLVTLASFLIPLQALFPVYPTGSASQ